MIQPYELHPKFDTREYQPIWGNIKTEGSGLVCGPDYIALLVSPEFILDRYAGNLTSYN